MRTALRVLRLISGALIFAIVLFLLAAAPGFLADASSTVPINIVVEAVR